MSIRELSPEEFDKEWRAGARPFVVDVRTGVEFAEKRLPMVESRPLQTLDVAALRREAGDRSILLVCKAGGRARQAADKLEAAGGGDLIVLTGGTDAWIAAGLEVTRNKGVISLERQVRITAGILVASFAVLSLTLDIRFVFGCLFVGCGLVFAGVTDWCGMGLLLARMPWNRNLTGASCSVKQGG